jgi:hypothetical protein
MTTKHIIGYILLGMGVLLMGYALMSSYSIFSGNTEPPEIFEEPTVQQQKFSGSQTAEQQVDAMLQQQLAKILPQDTISKTLNLFTWSVFAGLLIFGGAQIASIGIKLLRISEQEKTN